MPPTMEGTLKVSEASDSRSVRASTGLLGLGVEVRRLGKSPHVLCSEPRIHSFQ